MKWGQLFVLAIFHYLKLLADHERIWWFTYALDQHCSDEDFTTRPLLLVTASVDKIALKKPISVDIDLKLVGSVIWVGRSSIEIQLEVIQSSEGTFPVVHSEKKLFNDRNVGC